MQLPKSWQSAYFLSSMPKDRHVSGPVGGVEGISAFLDPVFYRLRHLMYCERVAQLTLPYDSCAPSGIPQCFHDSLVAGNVGGKLCFPELGPSCWNRCKPAVSMAVPEAAVDEDHCSVSREYDIGSAR